MSDLINALEKAVPSLTTYLQEERIGYKPTESTKTTASVKFLGVIWSGKTKVLLRVITDKVQAFPVPMTPKKLQEFLSILKYWQSCQTMVTCPEKSPMQEGKYPIPEDVWYTDGSSKRDSSKWRAAAHHPLTEMI